MKTTYLFLAFALSFNAFSVPLTRERLQDVITKNEKTPNTGVAIVVIHKGKVILREGFGYADRDTGRKVTPNTLFAIGSTSKAFTATSLLMMQDEGKLDLSKPVVEMLPDFKLKNDQVTAQINTYDLLSHHSGLPRHDAVWYYTPFVQDNLLERMAYLDFNPKPGMGFREGFQYNNLMFMVAGTVLEKISGISWDNFVQTRIFNQLEMNNTLTSITQFKPEMDIAVPYIREQKKPHYDIWNVKAAGAIYSNINDLEKWLRFLLAKGKTLSGKVLLSEENFNRMTERHTTIESGERDIGYGLGWVFDRSYGQNIILHGGNINGFTALITFYPEEEIGMAILVNQNGADLNHDLMQEAYLSLLVEQGEQNTQQLKVYLGKRHFNLNGLKKLLKLDLMPGEGDDSGAFNSELETWLGTYSDVGYGEMSIIKREGKYLFKYYLLEQELNEEFLKEIEVIRVDGKIIGIAVNMEDNAPKVRFLK